MIDVSVIICTHNPRPEYFSRALTALRNQTLPIDNWELLVIDNGSRDPLTTSDCKLSWHPYSRLMREDELGLSRARMRGMREAKAPLLVFVDDDNVLDPSYLAEAFKISRDWPQLGIWGGSTVPEFAVEPPSCVNNYASFLALREIKTERWCNVASFRGADPWGAGLSVRANVAAEYCRHYDMSSVRIGDRVGRSLLSGGDTEMCYVACHLGLGMGLFPSLKLAHLIPKERLNEDYLVRACVGIHTSLFLIDYKWRGIRPSSPFSALNLLRICKNVITKRGIDRRMYVAELRAVVDARRIIAATEEEGFVKPLFSAAEAELNG